MAKLPDSFYVTKAFQSFGVESKSKGRAGSGFSFKIGKKFLNLGWSTPLIKSKTSDWKVVRWTPASLIAAIPTFLS